MRRWAKFLSAFNTLIHKLSIDPSSCIAGGFFLPHPTGIVFYGRAGHRLTLFSHALCVPRRLFGDDGQDHGAIGDRVSFGVHSIRYGSVSVGSDTKLTFRAVLAQDAPSGCVVASRAIRVRVRAAGPGSVVGLLGHAPGRAHADPALPQGANVAPTVLRRPLV
jgi:serine acetyltransferase